MGGAGDARQFAFHLDDDLKVVALLRALRLLSLCCLGAGTAEERQADCREECCQAHRSVANCPKKWADEGVKPENTPGKDFYDTGVALVTDKPAEGVESISVKEGMDLCWG